jgi:hypothetical protein
MSSIIDFSLVKDKIFQALESEKEREVLFSRFGLEGRKIETLENIGKRFSVTRERIRQIEKAVIKKIKGYKPLSSDYYKLHSFIQKRGGVVSEAKLQDFDESDNDFKILLNIMLVSSPKVIQLSNKYFKNAWVTDNIEVALISDIAKFVVGHLKENKKVLSMSEIIKAASNSLNWSTALVRAVVDSCFLVGQDVEGKYGLMSWGIIKPKNTRDRSYVVLKSIKKPLHYKKLTELICKENFKINKKVSIEAVHNELIRDPRFVLVGRGIYALKEWGYTPGTVADVIEEILKNSEGPMHKNDIIKKVLEKRFVRKNTILLNLQEKPQFERVVRAVYRLKGE